LVFFFCWDFFLGDVFFHNWSSDPPVLLKFHFDFVKFYPVSPLPLLSFFFLIFFFRFPEQTSRGPLVPGLLMIPLDPHTPRFFKFHVFFSPRLFPLSSTSFGFLLSDFIIMLSLFFFFFLQVHSQIFPKKPEFNVFCRQNSVVARPIQFPPPILGSPLFRFLDNLIFRSNQDAIPP